MSVIFLGAKNAGSVRTSSTVNKPSQPVSMTWNALFTNGDLPQLVGVPGLNVPGTVTRNDWYKYVIDPAANQGAFNFGVGKTAQINIARPQSYNAAAASYWFVGRVVLYVPSTGQVYAIGPRNYATLPWPTAAYPPVATAVPIENSNDVLPLVLSSSSQIEIWLESDVFNFGAGQGIVTPSTNIIITLFNFELPPVSVA